MWPGPSCDTETLCPPPAAQCQSVISVHKRTWAAPAGRQRSPCWPACAHWDPTWLHPMNRAPVLKKSSGRQNRTQANQEKKKKISLRRRIKEDKWGVGGWGEGTALQHLHWPKWRCSTPMWKKKNPASPFFFFLFLMEMRRLWRRINWASQLGAKRKGSWMRKGSFPLAALRWRAVWGHAVRHWGPEVEGEQDQLSQWSYISACLKNTGEGKTTTTTKRAGMSPESMETSSTETITHINPMNYFRISNISQQTSWKLHFQQSVSPCTSPAAISLFLSLNPPAPRHPPTSSLTSRNCTDSQSEWKWVAASGHWALTMTILQALQNLNEMDSRALLVKLFHS